MLKKYLINININYHHSTINVSNGTKSGERQSRSLSKMYFGRFSFQLSFPDAAQYLRESILPIQHPTYYVDI